ncbi:AAA family ATPase [Microbispora triticiradicis]|uniref:ATP-binding protein n=2 Tax=Microbispora TaxID=2005 RepID=A0ABY3LZR1_9ACTN|nr:MULTISPECIES: ATP-binding protein [Microbispora]TLP58734.1 ATP-binding protein [Microbispora fusca]TYB61567.1 ATP-binding protein [Microbispora tritici]
MLVGFRAANVLSFRGEFELSLLAPVGGDRVARTVDGLRISPVAAIFGANASGKTNVLAAMRWMRHAVLDSVADWARVKGVPRHRFALNREAEQETSLFEVDVVIEGTRYVYGFEVSDVRVETEWLHVYPRGSRRRQVWFDRDADRSDEYRFPSDRLKGPKRPLIEYTRPNALFLTAAGSLHVRQLAPLFTWFNDNLWFLGPGDDQHRRDVEMRRELLNPDFRRRVEGLLSVADLGVTGVEVEDRGDEPPEISLIHQGQDGQVPFDIRHQESLGTLAWLAFLGPMLKALDDGAVLLVDELESSLHPVIVAEVIRLFGDLVANPRGAQLVFTGHDVTLLGKAHLERPLDRDQVWITEKRSTGESELYPLTEVGVRPDESMERGYLRGRYGGIPRIGLRGVALRVEQHASEGDR